LMIYNKIELKESIKHYGVVYKLTNTLNGKIYIGQSTNIIGRLRDYMKSNPEQNKRQRYAMMIEVYTVGITNFELSLLDIGNDQIDLWEKEKYWISTLNSTDPDIGYNKKTGGKGGLLNIDSRIKMSLGSMGFKHTEAEKLKRSKEIITYKGGYFNIFTSAKVLGDELGLDKAIVTHCIRLARPIQDMYVYYSNASDRQSVIDKITEPRKKKRYLLIARVINRGLETIGHYTILC